MQSQQRGTWSFHEQTKFSFGFFLGIIFMFFLIPWSAVIHRPSSVYLNPLRPLDSRVYKVDGRALAVGALLFNSHGEILVGERTLKWGHGKVRFLFLFRDLSLISQNICKIFAVAACARRIKRKWDNSTGCAKGGSGGIGFDATSISSSRGATYSHQLQLSGIRWASTSTWRLCGPRSILVGYLLWRQAGRLFSRQCQG